MHDTMSGNGARGLSLAILTMAVFWLLVGAAWGEPPTREQAAAAAATVDAYFNAAPTPIAAPVAKASPLAVTPKLIIPDTIVLPGERVAHVRVQLAEPVPQRQLAWRYSTFNDKLVYSPLHYKAASGTVTFLPGETEKLVDVPINADLPAGASIGFAVAWSQNLPPSGSANGFIKPGTVRTAIATAAPPVLPPAPQQSGRRLAFSSSFMEPISADAVKGAWRSRPAWGRVQAGNREIAPYANASTDPGTNPHPIIDGKRVLRAEHVPVKDDGKVYDFSASMLMSQNLLSFGGDAYLELRARIDRAQGTIPAFWLMRADGQWNNGPEIDIFEFGLTDAPQLASTIHFAGDPKGSMEGTVVPFTPDDGQFHTYGFDITPDWLISLIDGKEVHRRRNPYNAIAWQVILNVAVGGLAPAPKNPGAGWKSDMTLDYLKVWQ